MPLFLRLRILQIRVTAALLNSLGKRSAGAELIIHLRSNAATRRLLDSCLGFRRTFTSFAAAQARASKYIQAGHEHPDEIRFHTASADNIRESDYPVLFYLRPLASEVARIFDLGGNVGNLFYAYQRALEFLDELRWTVYDLPMKKPVGEQLAAARGETRIRFADGLADASGCDVFIASGSLHYFEEGLPATLNSFAQRPRHVFVNRTPFSLGADLITIQDNRTYLVPCKLHSRTDLIAGMQTLGYHLVAEWPVHERRLRIPTYPDLCSPTYLGFYFRQA